MLWLSLKLQAIFEERMMLGIRLVGHSFKTIQLHEFSPICSPRASFDEFMQASYGCPIGLRQAQGRPRDEVASE